MAKYESIKRAPSEIVQYYWTKFNSIYNSIPTTMQPPQGLALIKFPNGFDANMSYQLRERNISTLKEIQRNEFSVEANLLAKRVRLKAERRVIIKEEPSSSSSDVKV